MAQALTPKQASQAKSSNGRSPDDGAAYVRVDGTLYRFHPEDVSPLQELEIEETARRPLMELIGDPKNYSMMVVTLVWLIHTMNRKTTAPLAAYFKTPASKYDIELVNSEDEDVDLSEAVSPLG